MADCMLHMAGGRPVPTSQMQLDQSDQPTNYTEQSYQSTLPNIPEE